MDTLTFLLSKKYVDDTLQGAGALVGKSAYQVAVDNGFKGTEQEWLKTLVGDTPAIGPSGTWIVGDFDTGVIASPSLAGYATEEYVNRVLSDLSKLDLSAYATRKELNEAILGIKIPDVSNFITRDEVKELIDSLELPDGATGMIALSKEEVLTICR